MVFNEAYAESSRTTAKSAAEMKAEGKAQLKKQAIDKNWLKTTYEALTAERK